MMTTPVVEKQNINPIKLGVLGLIVIMLLGVTLAAFLSAQTYANDQIRISDINLLQKFLSAYKQDHGVYPISVAGKPQGSELYLQSLPTAPVAASVCSINQNQYTYSAVSSGASYSLSFCLGNTLSGFHKGVNLITPVS
jgi:hypothetical protein